jgi:penicillin-binding protein 1C
MRRLAWATGAFCLVLLAGWLSLRLVPLPRALFVVPAPELEFLDRHGTPLRIVRSEDEPFRTQVGYGEIPQPLVQATLAAEDRRFWKHPGVDWRATLRACWQLVRYRRVISGGSTITQQLIKLSEPRRRTFKSKLVEALQALRLEQVWDKQRILAEYLNRVDYGNLNRGCSAAARFYFAKPLRELSPAECALLAGVPQAPSRLNPRLHFERSQKRQQWVLAQMRQAGWLSEDEFRRAQSEPLRLATAPRAFEAPHFVELILSTMERNEAARGPIRTTLDLGLNRCAEQTVQWQVSRLEPQHVSNGAVVVIENETGEVLALVGSKDYFAPAGGQVNATWAARSVGSTFKPFTYLLALEHGATPATVVADVPTEFSTPTGLFAPVNYDRHYYGPMRYRVALANSLNVSAVKVLASVGGPGPLQELMRNCGLATLTRSPVDYGLGLTIGTGEARLLELANAYACLARLGEFRPYQLVMRAGDRTIPASAVAPKRVADRDTVYLVADMLTDNEARTLAFGAESPLRFDFPVACKTGTSSDFRDNWAFGFTPEFTVGVWVGNDDGTPMQHISGVTGAAPILHEVFEYLHERFGTSWYATPTNIVECEVHCITGKRLREPPTEHGSEAVKEKFLASNLPPIETPEDYEPPASTEQRVDPTPDTRHSTLEPVRLGPEYRDWLASSDNWLAGRAVLQAGNATNGFRIVSPLPGTVLYLDADLPEQGRRLTLRAAGVENVQWQSDTLEVVREAGRSLALLSPGRHVITARTPGGEAATWVEVKRR